MKKLILVIAFLLFGFTVHAAADTLVGNLREPGAIAEDDNNVYFVDRTFFNVTEVIPGQDPSLFTDINGDVFTDPLPFPFTTYNIKKVSKADGTVTALISSLSSIPSIATDGVFVYYVNQGSSGAAGTGAVLKVPVSGGTVTPLAIGLNNPVDLAIGDDTVVFIERGYSSKPHSSLFNTCRDFIDNDGDGGIDAPRFPPSEDFDSGCDVDRPSSVDSDGDLFTNLTERFLGSYPLNPDSTPESLVLDSILDLRQSCRDGIDNDLDGLIDGDDPGCIDDDLDGVENIVELDLGSDPEDENSTPEHRDFDESRFEAASTGRVSKVPMGGGGAVTPLVSRLMRPSKVVIDSGHVYFIEVGQIRKIQMDGSGLQGLIPTRFQIFSSPVSLAVDDTHAYFVDTRESPVKIKKISKLGMDRMPTDLAETEFSGEIAIDACSVYFFTREDFSFAELRGVRKSGGPPFTLATDIISPRDLVVDDRVYFTDDGRLDLPTDGKVWSAVPLLCPSQAIVSLRGLVLTLATQVLNPGQVNSLISKLNVAEKHSNTSKKATSKALNAFINQTTSFVRKGILPMKQGIELINQAETIINAIEKPQVQPPPDIEK